MNIKNRPITLIVPISLLNDYTQFRKVPVSSKVNRFLITDMTQSSPFPFPEKGLCGFCPFEITPLTPLLFESHPFEVPVINEKL